MDDPGSMRPTLTIDEERDLQLRRIAKESSGMVGNHPCWPGTDRCSLISPLMKRPRLRERVWRKTVPKRVKLAPQWNQRRIGDMDANGLVQIEPCCTVCMGQERFAVQR